MQNLPQRKPTRLKEFNYSANRIYYLTIYTKNRVPCLGTASDGQMHLSKIGEMAKKCWMNISDHFPGVEIMDFVIMPDHLHGILKIQKSDENNVIGHDENRWDRYNADLRNSHGEDMRNRHACSLQLKMARNHQKLPVIIGSFKSSVTRMVRKSGYDPYFAWQKSYYDRIIRNEKELNTIQEYIKTNPISWTPGEHLNDL